MSQELWIKKTQFVQNISGTFCGLFGFTHIIASTSNLLLHLSPILPDLLPDCRAFHPKVSFRHPSLEVKSLSLSSHNIMHFSLGTLNNLLWLVQCVSSSYSTSSLAADWSIPDYIWYVFFSWIPHANLQNNNIKRSLCLCVHLGAVVQTLLDWPGCGLAAWCSKNQRLGNEGNCDTRTYYSTELFARCKAFGLENPWWWVVLWPFWAKH